MNRLIMGLLAIAGGTGIWLLSGANAQSASPQATSSVQYLETNAFQKERAFSPAVATQGGRIIWLAGHEAASDSNGKLAAADFEGQARASFAAIDHTLKREGGSLQNLVSMTVFIKDARYGDELVKVRREMFPNGKFPASTLVTITGLAQPGMLIEIQGIAVIPN